MDCNAKYILFHQSAHHIAINNNGTLNFVLSAIVGNMQ